MKPQINYTRIASNFVYPEISHEDYRFGVQLDGKVLRADGDWRDFVPPSEDQNVNGVESSACYVEAQQHALATLQEEEFNEADNNYASAWNVINSDGTEQGGDPIKGAQSIRHDGLVPENLLPFTDKIKTWQDFASFKVRGNPDLCKKVGQEWLKTWTPAWEIVFERNEDVKVKYTKLRQALTRGPVPISVCAWFERDGVYFKPEYAQDNHLTLCVYVDEQNRPYFWDTYSPYLKIGEPFYDSDFAMLLSLNKKEEPVKPIKVSWFTRFINFFAFLFKKPSYV